MQRQERIHLDAAPVEALAHARRALDLDADGRGALAADPNGTLVVTAAAAGTGTELTLVAEHGQAIPYFGWFFSLVERNARRRSLTWSAAAIDAEIAGTPPPTRPRLSPLTPPSGFEGEQAGLLAAVCFMGTLTGFAAALFGQFANAIATTFRVSDSGLADAAAITRFGALFALFAAALADRIGRRRVLLGSLLAICLGSLLSAVAPTFALLTAAQIVVRAGVNTALIVGGIAVVEEAPDGARAFSIAMLGLAAGAGYALSVALLPIADLGRDTWRIAFGVAAVIAVLVPRLARQLPETRRYGSLAARTKDRGRLREVLDRSYGRRLALLAGLGFLSNVFSAPSAQFTNRYLEHERGFSGSSIAGFKAVTNGIPGLAGILLAGKLAESRGRRPVAIIGLLVGTGLSMVFFLSTGPILWIASSIGIIAGASGTLSVGAMDAELFATEVRGTANGILLICSVLGSVTGFLLTSVLRDQIGSLGGAIAVCGIAPVLAAVFLLPHLPESSGRSLDDVSPSEV